MKTILLDTSIDYTSWDIDEVGSIEMTDWQPIETAPKDDGMPIIVYGSSEYNKTHKYVHLAHWEDCMNRWMFEGEDMYPTHWMPLPPPPKKGDE